MIGFKFTTKIRINLLYIDYMFHTNNVNFNTKIRQLKSE